MECMSRSQFSEIIDSHEGKVTDLLTNLSPSPESVYDRESQENNVSLPLRMQRLDAYAESFSPLTVGFSV